MEERETGRMEGMEGWKGMRGNEEMGKEREGKEGWKEGKDGRRVRDNWVIEQCIRIDSIRDFMLNPAKQPNHAISYNTDSASETSAPGKGFRYPDNQK